MEETVVHAGSKDTYDHIAQWIAPDFFFSKKDKWERFGILAVFADFVLNCTNGDVAEIGVGESSIYLGHVAKKYIRKMYHCDISSSKIDNPLTVKDYIQEDAICIRDSSDKMFESRIISGTLALAFIDGDHHYEQAKKDFYNFVPLMTPDGYILLHDTYPPDGSWTHENACGDVYKLRQEIEKDPRFDCITLPKGCVIGVGLTIVRVKQRYLPVYQL
jgi:predicted O-methyltransferase YrrM